MRAAATKATHATATSLSMPPRTSEITRIDSWLCVALDGAPFPRRRNFYGSHSRGSSCLNAHVCIFKNQTAFRRDSKFGGRQQEAFRVRLALLVVTGADHGVESIEELQRIERSRDRFPGAARDDGEWNPPVLCVNMFHDFGNRFQLREKLHV